MVFNIFPNKTNRHAAYLQKYQNKLWQMARTLLGDDEEARDVVGDVGERALLKGMPENEDEALRWLKMSVKNACVDRIRRLKVRQRFMQHYSLEDEADVTTVDEQEQLWTEIRRFIDTELTEQDRRVVCLRFDDGCSYREISLRLGISEAAVYKHLAKALRLLRKQFSNY